MKQRLKGKPRKVTDEAVAAVLAWRPLKQLAAELGMSRDWAHRIRTGYRHKKPSPERV